MSLELISGRTRKIVQILLALVGALLVVYAISDNSLYGGEPGFGRTQAAIAAAGVGLALCALLRTEIAERILLVAVASLMTLAFAEIAGEIMLGPRFRPIYQPDDRLIFKFIPDRRSVVTRSAVNGGQTVAHRINSDGFRGDPLRPAGSATRVVVYGDSFIHAFYSPHDETFTAQLGARLAARLGREIEVVNAGVSSYGPDQISLKMEDELPWLRPDLAIVAVFAGNDYGDLLRDKMFLLGPDGTLVENRWRLDPKVRGWFELSQRESILKRALRGALNSMRRSGSRHEGVGETGPEHDLTNLDFLLKEAEREYRSFVVDRDDTVTNTHMDYYSADVSLTPKSASARYKVALMAAVLRRIRDVAARQGVPLAFLFIPHPVDVTDHYDSWKIDRKRFPDYDGRNQTAPLEAIARAIGVPFVSLYDAFRARDANALYFHEGDDHWNGAGQRLAAQVMADYLVARGLPDGRSRHAAR